MAPQPDSTGVYKDSEFLSLSSQDTSRFTTTDVDSEFAGKVKIAQLYPHNYIV